MGRSHDARVSRRSPCALARRPARNGGRRRVHLRRVQRSGGGVPLPQCAAARRECHGAGLRHRRRPLPRALPGDVLRRRLSHAYPPGAPVTGRAAGSMEDGGVRPAAGGGRPVPLRELARRPEPRAAGGLDLLPGPARHPAPHLALHPQCPSRRDAAGRRRGRRPRVSRHAGQREPRAGRAADDAVPIPGLLLRLPRLQPHGQRRHDAAASDFRGPPGAARPDDGRGPGAAAHQRLRRPGQGAAGADVPAVVDLGPRDPPAAVRHGASGPRARQPRLAGQRPRRHPGPRRPAALVPRARPFHQRGAETVRPVAPGAVPDRRRADGDRRSRAERFSGARGGGPVRRRPVRLDHRPESELRPRTALEPKRVRGLELPAL